ncbi:MAG: hypothetical protein FJ145_12555 [Deltaproteobacteria bacterium]|nr:hypothetical protein [Deltaproteobacteria bacterium]
MSLLGCATQEPTFVSQPDVEHKLSRIVVGQTHKNEVEAVLGVAKPKEQTFWVYNIADTATEYQNIRSPIMEGAIPPLPTTVITNTRVLATFHFDSAGIVKAMETARYFSVPYINEYRYRTKGAPDKILESVAKLGESAGFKVTALQKNAGTFTLEDAGSKARMAVSLADEFLQITSTNPHDRMSNEYRAYTKREVAFTERLAYAEWAQ